MILIPFKPEHVAMVKLQSAQSNEGPALTIDYGTELAAAGDAFTLMDGNEIVFCGGKGKYWEGRWGLWVMLSDKAHRHMYRITRIVKRWLLLQAGSGRFEAIVRSDFGQGHRWVLMLGFKHEYHAPRFLPDGSDADIYVRFP